MDNGLLFLVLQQKNKQIERVYLKKTNKALILSVFVGLSVLID